MTESERKIMQANIKLQDENNDIKYENSKLYEIIEQIRTYIIVNKDENNKVNGQNILEIIGDNYVK